MRVWIVAAMMILFGLGVFLLTAPVTQCSNGKCPALSDGSCGAVAICGTMNRLGHCVTVTKRNGTKTCTCVAN